MVTQTDRKIAEEQRKTYEVQQMAQEQRQALVRAKAVADIQEEMVKSEKSVDIATLKAQADVQQATGEAKSTQLRAEGEANAIRSTGQARAEVYRLGVEALGTQGFTTLQMMQIVGDKAVRIVPDVAVNGNSGGGGLAEGLLGLVLREKSGE